MSRLILAVAGHVDHGKTALVKALTGTDTDTLAEEKRRGLTIEPGFAVLPLPGGGTADLVDVPGHEKFIRNMLTGAAGADGVLLTVDTGEGVMSQTREHLALCALLGMEQGIVAVTKADLADENRLAQFKAECAALTAGTFLEGAPILPVSAKTGLGLDELRAAIAALPPRRRRTDLPSGWRWTGSSPSKAAELWRRVLCPPDRSPPAIPWRCTPDLGRCGCGSSSATARGRSGWRRSAGPPCC